MAKRKTRKRTTKRKPSKNQNINFKIINILLVIIVILILAIAVLLYMVDLKHSSKEDAKKKIEKQITNIEKTSKEKIDSYVKEVKVKKDEFEEYTQDLYKEYIQEKEEKTTTEPTKEELIIKQAKKDKEKKQKTKFHKVLPFETQKPKLAIIIDDVTTQYQINKINKIGYKTNLSILPPTSRNGSTTEMTKNLPFYMIHFPMEAKYFHGEEQGTLHIKDSYEKIEKRVAQIRDWYPNARFTNNHTGSKFTENKEAMNKFFKAIKKYDFVFLDSRTTSKSVGKEMARKYHIPYLARNVFLDNEQNFAYIQKQLKQAIRIAKKRGYAIAIGHPHNITIEVLKESKHLLKDLELIYVNQVSLLKSQ